jgi:hypothetical protein
VTGNKYYILYIKSGLCGKAGNSDTWAISVIAVPQKRTDSEKVALENMKF